MTRKTSPQGAVDRYLKERKPEITESTHRNHKYTLNAFLEWTEKVGIEAVSELGGMYLHEFKLDRRERGINEVTLYGNLCTIP